jgi:hypothetical protein
MYNIDWKKSAIEHIAKHHVRPFEVEESIREDAPRITARMKD